MLLLGFSDSEVSLIYVNIANFSWINWFFIIAKNLGIRWTRKRSASFDWYWVKSKSIQIPPDLKKKPKIIDLKLVKFLISREGEDPEAGNKKKLSVEILGGASLPRAVPDDSKIKINHGQKYLGFECRGGRIRTYQYDFIKKVS